RNLELMHRLEVPPHRMRWIRGVTLRHHLPAEQAGVIVVHPRQRYAVDQSRRNDPPQRDRKDDRAGQRGTHPQCRRAKGHDRREASPEKKSGDEQREARPPLLYERDEVIERCARDVKQAAPKDTGKPCGGASAIRPTTCRKCSASMIRRSLSKFQD